MRNIAMIDLALDGKVAGVMRNALRLWQNKAKSVQPASLVALWPGSDLTGAEHLADASGNGLDGHRYNVTSEQAGIGDDGKSARYDGSTSYTNLYSAGLNAAFDKTEITLIQWVKVAAESVWSTTGYKWITAFAYNGSNEFGFHIGNTAGYLRFYYYAGGTVKVVDMTGQSSLSWMCLGLTISKANDRLRAFMNGSQYGVDVTGLGVWTGAFSPSTCAMGSHYGSVSSNGVNAWLGPCGLWKSELTPAEVGLLASPFDVAGILFVGDSKTENGSWRVPLRESLYTTTKTRWVERPAKVGISGATILTMQDRVDADITGMAGITAPREIHINLGANDVAGGGFNAAACKADLDYMIDAYHAAFPAAKIRIAKIWRRFSGGIEANIAALNGKIDELYAAHSWLATGINEADFLPGGDDGATTTSDGVHPNAAGGLLEAAAWMTAMGY